MHISRNGTWFAVLAVIGLVVLFHHGHPPALWANTCKQSVSAGFALHMAELELRRTAATLGRIISFH